jgi:hypothetical protein
MFGTYQQSSLRIEISATQQVLRDSLLQTSKLERWLSPQRLSAGLPEELTPGITFTSWLGPIAVQHQVEKADANSLCLILSQGIDGVHEWHWGEGWVQSQIEGISFLPIRLGHTLSLLRLRQFLVSTHSQPNGSRMGR